MSALIHLSTARLAAVAQRVLGDGPDRGDISGWAALGGLATVGTVTMVARYHDLLVQAMVKATDTALNGMPGV